MTRMITILSLVTAIMVGSVTAYAARPNVIVIFADDQGYGDLGCYGSPNIETPNIDRMAAEGIRFTSFYAAPFCGPSRAQLMTGCYHARVSHSFNPSPGSKNGLHPNEVTIAEVLKTVGYRTMHIGKWHLGDEGPLLPTNQGFDEYFGLPFSNDMWPYHPKMPPREGEDALMKQMRARADYTGFAGQGSYYDVANGGGFPNPLPLMRGTEVIEHNPDQTQLTQRYTEAARKFIRADREQPFFLYLAHAMPHVPLFVSERFRGKSSRGLYGDVMMEIDWSCGEILSELKALGIEKDTLVIYTSDNGPWLQYGIDGGSAGSLRAGKGSVWEGGVRVPGIFHWPGNIPGGRRTEAIAGTLDILPTVAHLAGAELPQDRVLDGVNLWSLLAGESSVGARQFFHYFAGARPGRRANHRGVRDARWKLLTRLDSAGVSQAVELYDLGSDPSERTNRLKAHPEVAERLMKEVVRFLPELEAQRRPAGQITVN